MEKTTTGNGSQDVMTDKILNTDGPQCRTSPPAPTINNKKWSSTSPNFRVFLHHVNVRLRSSRGRRVRKKTSRIQLSTRSSHQTLAGADPMQALRSRRSRAQLQAVSPEPAREPSPVPPQESKQAEATQPGIFKRILRKAQSKKNISEPVPEKNEKRSERHAVIPENRSVASDASAKDNKQTSKQNPQEPSSPLKRSKPSLRSKFYASPADETLSTATKPTQTYVPKHAASDFSRINVSNPTRGRNSFSADDDARYTFTQPPQTGRHHLPDGVVPLSHIVEKQHERPETSATNDTLDPTSDPYRAPETANLQPPPAPSAGRRKSHFQRETKGQAKEPVRRQQQSYRTPGSPPPAALAPPPESHHHTETPSSDYQQFLQKAVEDDRVYRAQVWRTLSKNSSRKPYNPATNPYEPPSHYSPANPPVVEGKVMRPRTPPTEEKTTKTRPCNLQRTGTFGGSKENSNTTKRDSRDEVAGAASGEGKKGKSSWMTYRSSQDRGKPDGNTADASRDGPEHTRRTSTVSPASPKRSQDTAPKYVLGVPGGSSGGDGNSEPPLHGLRKKPSIITQKIAEYIKPARPLGTGYDEPVGFRPASRVGRN